MTQLMLIFRLGSERYALATTSVVEIIPRVALSGAQGGALSGAQSGALGYTHQAKPTSTGSPEATLPIAGRFNYHGQVVSVLDLSQILKGTRSRPALGTRIILVALAPSLSLTKSSEESSTKPDTHLVGFLVEQVTETLEGHEFCQADEATDAVRPSYLEKTLLYQQEIIQYICLERLMDVLIAQGIVGVSEHSGPSSEAVAATVG